MSWPAEAYRNAEITATARRRFGREIDQLSTRNLMPLLLGAITLACGSSPTRQPPTTDVQAGASLMAALQNIKTQKTNEAKVTFAIFGGSELTDSDALNALVKTVVKETAGRRLPRRHQPFIVTHPNNAELPLDVPSLAQSLGPIGAHLAEANHVAFVRYVGPAQRDHRQVKLALAVTAQIAQGDQVIVDLSTRTAFKPTDFDALRNSEDWLTRQVRPGAERNGDRITFFSRGMIKLGLPDLEQAQVDPKEARAAFERFQVILGTMQSKAAIKVGDTIEGVTLTSCRRAPEAIEGQCVGLP